MVELALVIGVLIAVALVIVDFGKAINFWNDENQVADQAARYAAVGNLPTTGRCASGTTSNGITVSNLSTYIDCQLYADAPELYTGGGTFGVHGYGSAPGTNTQGAGATVCISVPSNAVGQPVTVKVTGDYDWLPLPILGGSSFHYAAISGTATMRLEAPYPWSDSQATACT